MALAFLIVGAIVGGIFGVDMYISSTTVFQQTLGAIIMGFASLWMGLAALLDGIRVVMVNIERRSLDRFVDAKLQRKVMAENLQKVGAFLDKNYPPEPPPYYHIEGNQPDQPPSEPDPLSTPQ